MNIDWCLLLRNTAQKTFRDLGKPSMIKEGNCKMPGSFCSNQTYLEHPERPALWPDEELNPRKASTLTTRVPT